MAQLLCGTQGLAQHASSNPVLADMSSASI